MHMSKTRHDSRRMFVYIYIYNILRIINVALNYIRYQSKVKKKKADRQEENEKYLVGFLFSFFFHCVVLP